jgi:NAD(P)-dependent dehydrogenase (short-subunit alcohol dehydrogenase family)
MDNGINGRTAVVIGTSGNLGPIWCASLKEAGARVLHLDKGQSNAFNVDVTDIDSLERARLLIDRTGNDVSILVYNAAIDNPPGSDASFFGNAEEIMRVNWLGAVNAIKTFSPGMLEKGRGDIVVIGSMLGFVAADHRNYEPPFDKPCAYGSSKAALWNLVKNCGTRYAARGVAVNMLALSAVEGNHDEAFNARYAAKIPTGRMLKPEDFTREFLTCCAATVPYDYPIFVGGGWTLW